MDEFLARGGYWVAWAALASSAAFSGDGEHRPLGYGLVLMVSTVALPVALRASALRFDRRRGGRPPPRWPAQVRRTTERLRWPLAVAYGAGAAWYAQWHHDVPWFSAAVGAVAAAAVGYVARPLPADVT
ncbi:MAG: hypothetical protein QOE45_558 [Frankiaceae bacterium]|nr:hypothetical protein [Frankiaceae bacterium]